MSSKRAARISRAGEIGVNPDQRIQADAQHLTEFTTDLGIGLLQSSILLVSFIGVLWMLSQGVVLHDRRPGLRIPGYMVWAALLYAVSGSLVSWRVGRPLVRLGADRYAREAEFRSRWCAARARRGHRAQQRRGGRAGAGSRRASAPLVGVLRQIAFARDAADLGDGRLWLGRRSSSRSSSRRPAISPAGCPSAS